MRPGRILLRGLACALLAVTGVGVREAVAAAPTHDALREAALALAASRTDEASPRVAALEASAPDDPDVLALGAELRFQRADYDAALTFVRRALALRRADEDLKALRDRIEGSLRVTRGFVTARVGKGRFVVRHPPGRDAVLLPYVEQALGAAVDALAADFGQPAPATLVVEVLPDAQALSRLSGLPLADVERTGTVAVSKWGRLMVTSPRALVRGYPWLDTLTHEYVHLVVSRATDDRAPIWLQEGLAKFEERRWREPAGGRLEPTLAYLLDRAAQTNRFIPFARMHPSIARLPTQEDAALAFAEVFTFVRFLHDKRGYEGLRDVLARVRAGEDAMAAVAAAYRAPWATIYRWWRGEIRAHRNAPPRAARVLERRFRQGSDARAEDETSDIESARARRFARLGDLLWERRREAAAAVEYGRAHEVAPGDPVVANRLARAYLETGRAGEVPAALEEALALYPDYPASHVHLGRALRRDRRARPAVAAFEEAVRLNPFDPEPHCALADLLQGSGERAAHEEAACAMLR